MRPLLSIVIPTYNRYQYLVDVLDVLLAFDGDDFEVIVQDNSEDNAIMLDYMKRCRDSRLRYFHDAARHYSQTENSELAVGKATGRFVCYIGDDDVLSQKVLDIVGWMEAECIEALLFQGAHYYWPDVVFSHGDRPHFTVRRFTAGVRKIDPLEKYAECANYGACDINEMPRLYHGIVSRVSLDKARLLAGSFFPGPSPDMASSVALSHSVRKLVAIDVPVLIDGFSYKSAGGKSLRGEHKAHIEDVDQLPNNIVDTWNPSIPRIWLGETIYAQSYYEASSRMGLDDGINYRKLYSSILARNPDCWPYVIECDRSCSAASVMLGSLVAFSKRAMGYASRLLRRKRDVPLFSVGASLPIVRAEAELSKLIAPCVSEVVSGHVGLREA